MALTIEERLTRLEERLDKVEATLARQKRSGIGVTVEEVRAKRGRPVQRGPEQFERLRRIFGRFSGPGDLSVRMRDYLYGDRG